MKTQYTPRKEFALKRREEKQIILQREIQRFVGRLTQFKVIRQPGNRKSVLANSYFENNGSFVALLTLDFDAKVRK